MASVDTSIKSCTTGRAADFADRHETDHPLKLYGGWFCPFVQRSWIVLHEKNIPHQYIEINPYHKDAAFLEMNPRGLIPTLAVPVGGQGGKQKSLYDSTIVSEYLDEAYADPDTHGPRLLPADPYERARAKLWIDYINTRIVPGFYKFIQHDPKDLEGLESTRQNFLEQLRLLASEMSDTSPWFLGENFSLVDVMVIPWAMRLWLIDHYKPGGVGIPAPGGGGEHEADWARWRVWFDAAGQRQSVKDTLSDKDKYIEVYKRYADNTTNSLVGQATRAGNKMP